MKRCDARLGNPLSGAIWFDLRHGSLVIEVVVSVIFTFDIVLTARPTRSHPAKTYRSKSTMR